MYPKKTTDERHMHPRLHQYTRVYPAVHPAAKTHHSKISTQSVSSSKMWHLSTVDRVSLTGSCH